MIDIESKVYTPIAEQLREKYPGIDVAGEYINAPPNSHMPALWSRTITPPQIV